MFVSPHVSIVELYSFLVSEIRSVQGIDEKKDVLVSISCSPRP